MELEIKRYIAIIWHWAWLIILGAAVAGGVAYLISKNTTPVYSSSSRLLIDEAPGGSGNDYSQLLLEQQMALTYVEILQTTPVLQETIDRLELPFTTAQLASKVSVSTPQETQIIVVSIEDTKPNRAALISNTLGQVFIDQNQARASLRYAEPITNWQARLDEMSNEIEDIEVQIANLAVPETAEDQAALSRLETQLNGSQIRYTEAFNNLNELQVDQAKESNNIIQIEPAQAPLSPIRPRTMSNTLLAIIVGGMTAVGLIFMIEYLDDSITSPDQIAEDTNLSTLGTIAQIDETAIATRLITQHMPRDPISEAYRVLRTNLGFSAVDDGLHSVLVTSSSPSEGKSTTASNLAIVMAQAGKRVVIVDADLRRPVQHGIFEVSNNHGLTTAILDKKTALEKHIQSTQIPNLHILTSGPIPPNPSELLNSQRMAEIITSLKEITDIIIFDTPPTLTVADAAILAPQVAGTIIVAKAGKTTRSVLVQAVTRLQSSNGTIFGAVLNQLTPSRSGYYYYYHTYEYDQKKQSKSWFASLIKR